MLHIPLTNSLHLGTRPIVNDMAFPYVFPFVFGGSPPATDSGYARQLKQLLPQGALWNLEPSSWISKVILAMSAEFAHIENRGRKLITESDPRTADETLEEWESFLSLPDERVTSVVDLTDDERRVAITQKYTSQGGQSDSFFIELAAACGYTVTVSNYNADLLRVGFRVGDRCYGLPFAYAILITVTAIAATALPQADFERVIRHEAHAHIEVGFDYP